ncbi:unnamed protein product, partial [Iphiclides podalirius]
MYRTRRSRSTMDDLKLELKNNLQRSKSLSSLEILDNVSNGLKVFQQRLTRIKDSVAGSDASMEAREQIIYDEVLTNNSDSLNVGCVTVLERKIERLSDLLQEQQKFLVEIKRDLKKSVLSSAAAAVFGNKSVAEKSPVAELTVNDPSLSTRDDVVTGKANNKENDNTKTLLEAIEYKNAQCLEREIKDALTNFLQSDELKAHVISTTEVCVKEVIRSSFCQDFSASYLPILERSHRRLLKHVTKVLEDSFKDLEESSAIFSKSVENTAKTLHKALERHQALLEEAVRNKNLLKNLQNSLQEVLQKELKEWRENLFNVVFTRDNRVVEDVPPNPASPNQAAVSPPQPADPERSILEQLMKSAEIKEQIKAGNVNGSFERALSSADLSLVMAACRAADPARLFSGRCELRQCVLLSLIQQLATDMVHDTQLKCRYLEEAIINLNTLDPVTRSHLPTIVEEVQKHLTKFLKSYPSHVASRRITLIIMAAKDLLKLL